MATVTFILGLCGSGKSYLAEQMATERGLIKFDENFINEESQQRILVEALRRGDDCVVVEITYCDAAQRDIVIDWLQKSVPGAAIEWIAFENDLEKSNLNCCRRKNKGRAYEHMRINHNLSLRYTLPDGAKVLPILLISGD